MSEFEREMDDWEASFSSLSTWQRELPSDFSEDDKAFKQELDELFSIGEEKLPPYFVQTLLEVEDERFRVVERGFEHKTRAQVFRRLKLRRKLFYSGSPSLKNAIGNISITPVKRPLMALIAAALAFMLMTVIFTAPSFAYGMYILLGNGHTGVMQVHSFPKNVTHSRLKPVISDIAQPKTMSLFNAQEKLHFTMQLPQSMPMNYALNEIALLPEQDQSWADGPTIQFSYIYSSPGVAPHGTGQIAIREFKLMPKANVFQVVEQGAAQVIQVNETNHTQAIYIDGQWVLRGIHTPVWVYGARSTLIYESNDVIYWIVGDQRDGIDMNALLKIAASLQAPDFSQLKYYTDHMYTVIQLDSNNPGLFSFDLLAIFSDDGINGLYFKFLEPDDPSSGKLPASKVTVKISTHSS